MEFLVKTFVAHDIFGTFNAFLVGAFIAHLVIFVGSRQAVDFLAETFVTHFGIILTSFVTHFGTIVTSFVTHVLL